MKYMTCSDIGQKLLVLYNYIDNRETLDLTPSTIDKTRKKITRLENILKKRNQEK